MPLRFLSPRRTLGSSPRPDGSPAPARGLALATGALVAATLALAPVGSGISHAGTPPTSRATAAAAATPPPTCAALAASLSRSEQVGQLLMVGISTRGMSTSQARTLARGHVGSVVLLGNSTAGRTATRRLATRVHGVGGRPRGVGLLLAVDQEGGQVQRLRGSGFDRIPSAREQATLSDARLRSRAERWGDQLRLAGIDADLAPVADVVPRGMERTNAPIGRLQRGYGPKPSVVATKVPAFITGMDRAGVATAVKHYPGLGRVRGNTDFVANVVDSTTTRDDAALRGFAAATKARVDMVMMSSATYTKIDKRHRAVYSKIIMGQMLRRDLGFRGVIISDDLSVRAVQDLSPGKRAVTFLAAGGDLIIVGDPTEAPAMITAVKARAAADPAFRTELRHKVTRVLQLKARRGLAGCR